LPKTALYSTLHAIVTSYDARLQQRICKPLMLLWKSSLRL